MTDRVLSWELPPVGPRQRPHDFVRIEFRSSPDFDFQTLVDEPAGNLLLSLPDVNPGQMFYRGTLFDIDGVPCPNSSEVSADAPFDPPGDLLSFTVTDV